MEVILPAIVQSPDCGDMVDGLKITAVDGPIGIEDAFELDSIMEKLFIECADFSFSAQSATITISII